MNEDIWAVIVIVLIVIVAYFDGQFDGIENKHLLLNPFLVLAGFSLGIHFDSFWIGFISVVSFVYANMMILNYRLDKVKVDQINCASDANQIEPSEPWERS